MKENKTEVILLLDRSGSMNTCQSDMEGGINTFIEDQKKEKGECYVSLINFDDEYDIIFENTEISKVGEIKIYPRGLTALLDALGKTINSVGERLKKTNESERPDKVIFVVITDGLENDSKEFKRSKINEMIKHQEEKYSWEFIYLGANQDAISESKSMGFNFGSTMTYDTSDAGIKGMTRGLSNYVGSVRKGESYTFTAQDRNAAVCSGSMKNDDSGLFATFTSDSKSE